MGKLGICDDTSASNPITGLRHMGGRRVGTGWLQHERCSSGYYTSPDDNHHAFSYDRCEPSWHPGRFLHWSKSEEFGSHQTESPEAHNANYRGIRFICMLCNLFQSELASILSTLRLVTRGLTSGLVTPPR